MKFILVAVFSVGLVGCATMEMRQERAAAQASGYIGCAPKDIEISDLVERIGPTTYTATCKGKKYFCSVTEEGKPENVGCKAAQ